MYTATSASCNQAEEDPDVLEARGYALLARAAEIRAARRAAPPTEWLTLASAAEIAAVTPRTIRGAIARGELPAGRAGRRPLVRRADVEAWITRTRPESPRKVDPRDDVRAAIERAAARARRCA
jgi:excisionase family DNA binding protein